MDAKAIKAALKTAREAIREKDYKEALKHCKAILKADKNNYNALVFVGVAAEGLEQPEQALSAFKKATEINRDHLLGWQGLCGFYEKANKPEYTEDLISVYRKLIELQESDVAKCSQIRKKLVQLLEFKGEFEKCLELYHTLLNGVHDDAERIDIILQFTKFAQTSGPSLDEDQMKKMLSLYKDVIDNKADADMWIQYLKFLVKLKVKTEEILLAAERFSECHPDTSYPIELQARILVDLTAENSSKHISDLSQTLSRLESVKPESGYILLINGVQCLESDQLPDAKTQLSEGVESVKISVGGWYFLTRVMLKTHNKHQAYKAATQGLHLLASGSTCFCDAARINTCLQKLLAESCILLGTTKHLNEATTVIEQLLSTDKAGDDLCILQARIQLALNQTDSSLQVLERVKDNKSTEYLTLKGWLHHLTGDDEQARSCLTGALSRSEDYSLTHYYMARILFDDELRDPERLKLCLTHLLKAAKLDPFWSEVFLYLGYYYGNILKDTNKSVRCFQKAYDLDPDSEEVGAALIDSLMMSGEENKALSVLRSVTSHAKAGSAKWAWLRYGLYQLKHDDVTSAIISLQSALRADPTDFHCWECLGEAYMKRGSYTAALKAFTRATELDDSALFCYYQMATIKQLLGLYDEAVSAYKSILESSSYVPALKGLGETYLLMARAALKEFFHGRAVDYCQEALTVLTCAASQRADLSCVWKLLGDACVTLAPVPEAKICLSVPSKLISQSENTDGLVKINKRELMAVGSRCYGMAVKLQPECAALWQDLGISYFYQSKITDRLGVKTLTNKSIQCLQKALSLNPNNFRHWNTLGVLAASDEVGHPGLAQHCFIKSIQAEANNVTAWTNLGVLYLKSDEIKLAHEAFKVAQSLDPLYVACWIGQALVAELVQDEEAMDLFRHTTELGNHVEGAIGYGHWVCRILQNSEGLSNAAFDYAVKRMAALPAASDALAKYVDRVQDDFVAYNLYGLLLERQGLLASACGAFQKAIELVEGSNSNKKEQIDDIRTNYARVLCAANRAADSIEQYRKLSTLDTEDRLCGLGLALYKDELFGDSLLAYEKALSVADAVCNKSHIHTALGLVAYRMGDLNAAKRALFAGSQLEQPSLLGLQALLAIGLLANDETLCVAVLQEINKQSLPDVSIVTNKLVTAVERFTSTPDEIGKHILWAVHRHPDVEELWLEEAEHLLRPDMKKASAAFSCASTSMALGSHCTNDKLMKISKSRVSMQDKTLLLAFSGLAAGRHCPKKSGNVLSLAMKSVFIQPDNTEAWFVLLGALYSQQKIAPNADLQSVTISLTTHLMSRVESALSRAGGSKSRHQSLHLWCVKQYIVGLLEGGRPEQAQQFLQQAAWLYDEDLHLQVIAASFTQNFSRLKQLVTKDVTGFTYQLLISLYMTNGLKQEMEKAYQSWLSRATDRSEKLSCLVQMAHFSFRMLMTSDPEKDSSGKDKWKTLFSKACDQGLKLDPECTALWLMQGLIMLDDKKLLRSAKRSLHQVLQFSKNQLPHAADLARQHLLVLYTEKGDTEAIKELQEY